MNAEIAEDIYLDTQKDDSFSPPPIEPCECETCSLARLCNRQQDMIGKLSLERDALKSQVAALKEEIAAHVRGEA